MGDDVVELGKYVIIQRQNYMKLYKVQESGSVTLGKDQIQIENVIGEPYWSTYKIEVTATNKNKRICKLVKCKTSVSLTNEIIKDCPRGVDNREILDDGCSQKLSTDEIVNMKTSGLSAQGIVSNLVENSKTFHQKTEFSQEKYLKKKEKKYFEYITFRKPTLRLVSEIVLRNSSGKDMGLRMDTIAQLTTLACVRSGGKYMLYESGTQGVVAATLLNCIGTAGAIIHVHPGHTPQKHAVLSLNLAPEQLQLMHSVSIETLLKGCKYEEDSREVTVKDGQKRKIESEGDTMPAKRPRWQDEANRCLEVVQGSKMDGLVIVAKEHPANIFKALVRYLELSRPFVVYCSVREPLQELYAEVKARSDVIAVRLTESWLRPYQVLHERTHPGINMSGSGGYLLTGTIVSG